MCCGSCITPGPRNKFLAKAAESFYICSCAFALETAEPIVVLLNRGVSVDGIAAREVDGKRSRPEMAPQRLEKIESAPGNGMGSEASNLLDLVHGRAATVRDSGWRAARMSCRKRRLTL